MRAKSKDIAVLADRELWITHVFDAPRLLVFKAWTDPQHLARWSGPRGFSTTHSEVDVRPGGAYRSCLRSPEGADHWVQGVYREIVEPERLVFTHAWETPVGVRALETLVTVTFADEGPRTLMTFHQAVFESAASREGHQGGWMSSFERLQGYLATLRIDT